MIFPHCLAFFKLVLFASPFIGICLCLSCRLLIHYYCLYWYVPSLYICAIFFVFCSHGMSPRAGAWTSAVSRPLSARSSRPDSGRNIFSSNWGCGSLQIYAFFRGAQLEDEDLWNHLKLVTSN